MKIKNRYKYLLQYHVIFVCKYRKKLFLSGNDYDHVLDIYVFDSMSSKMHEWVKVINIAGKPLAALQQTFYIETNAR